MAIKVNYSTKFGIDLQDAYVSVDGLRINKSKVSANGATEINQYTLQFDAKIFANESAAKSGSEALEVSEMACVFDPTSIMFESAYAYLKTLPEFADAVDC